MIDYLTFIDELKAIKNANDTIESKKRVSGIIDQTVKKYENMINEFENDRERIENIWDSQENQQKLTLDNQVNS
jgi:two-component SAPR family response regulator|tara:strand:- start:710 stop:931 length:222 start_codon:yes stop_codon:yes gene_type:complete